MSLTVRLPLSRQQQPGHLWRQELGTGVEFRTADIGNGVRTDQVGEGRHAQQLRIGDGGIDEDAGDDRCRGEALLFERDPVVQTARRTSTSIAHAGNNNIGMPMQVRHNLRVGWQ